MKVRENNAVTNQAEIDKWIADDNLAVHYLFNTCGQEQQDTLLTCTSAHQIWSSLTSRYQQNTVEKRQSLQQEFLNYKLNPEHSIRVHVEAIKLLVKQFKDAGGTADDEGTINKILTSLPPSYHSFLSSWESAAIADRTLDNLTTRLIREEARNSLRNGGERSQDDKAFFGLPQAQPQSSATGPSPSSYPSRGGHRPSPYTRGGGKGAGRNSRNDRFEASHGNSRTAGRCTHCNILGHEERNCWYKLNGGTRCTHCQIFGHKEEECYSKQRIERNRLSTNSSSSSHGNSKGYAAGFKSESRSPNDFYLDSGATQHMTDQRWMLKSFTPFEPGSRWINGIGSVLVEVLGEGNIETIALINGRNEKRTMQNVLFAPTMGINLFSVGAATRKGAEIHFIDSRAFIVRDEILEMTARRVGDTLYVLEMTITREDEALASRSLQNPIQEWHRRLAHLNYHTIIKMAKSGAVEGLTLPPGTQPPSDRCHECAVGKMKRTTFSSSTSQSNRIGALIHSDVCGPMQVRSSGGALFYVLFQDDYSGFRHVSFLKQKSEVEESFKCFVALLHSQTGQLVTVLRSDNGGEYESSSFKAWLRKKGIRHETSVRYTPQQNGVSERDNRTLMEAARTLIHSNKALPLSLWAEAVSCVVYTLNRALSSTAKAVTPFESWYGRKPNISNLRVFGSEFYTLVPKEMRRKLDARGTLCIFVGNSDTQKGDRYWDPVTGKINVSRDVTPSNHHYENRLPLADVQQGVNVFPADPFPRSPSKTEATNPPAIDGIDFYPLEPFNGFGDPMEIDQYQEEEEEEPPLPVQLAHNEPHSSRPRTGPATDTPRRSARIQHQQGILTQSTSAPTNQREKQRKAFICAVTSPTLAEAVPNQYRDAIESSNASLWKVAIQKEYESLMKNKTWVLVALPEGASLIRSRWTFKLKEGFRDIIDRIYKARFVAKGYSQVPGVDYQETEIYSPVIKHDSLRVLLSIAAAFDLELHQLDVKTAFLYGDLDETLYVEQPEGFISPGKENLVCRLLKPLYGLKQSPRKWNDKFNSFLTKFGLTRSEFDPCIYFTTGGRPEDYIILGIWVDDGLIASKSRSMALRIVEYLEKHFEMTSGPANRFIGLEISRNRARKEIYVTQSSYIQTLLSRFRMTECNPSRLPADPCSRLPKSSTLGPEGNPNSTPYRALVGGLLYIMGMTRPDIAFAVIAVSRHQTNPENPHWKAAKRILAYLAGTPHHGLRYSGIGNVNNLVSFSDSDYAGCKDGLYRRSTSGMIFLLNGGPVAWKSHLQKPVAQSTAEAEYYAAGHACREIVWLRELLHQLGIRQPSASSLLCDNKSTISMIHNPVFHESTKHIEVKYHYIRQQVEKGKVSITSVPSSDQLADLLTKPLAGPAFELNRSRIGIVEADNQNQHGKIPFH